MKSTSPLEAALAWNALGLQWLETMAASGAVISRRMSRKASPVQLYRMGSEKWEAALESTAAMGQAMAALQTVDAFAMSTAWARMLSSGIAPYHARVRRNARARAGSRRSAGRRS